MTSQTHSQTNTNELQMTLDDTTASHAMRARAALQLRAEAIRELLESVDTKSFSGRAIAMNLESEEVRIHAALKSLYGIV